MNISNLLTAVSLARGEQNQPELAVPTGAEFAVNLAALDPTLPVACPKVQTAKAVGGDALLAMVAPPDVTPQDAKMDQAMLWQAVPSVDEKSPVPSQKAAPDPDDSVSLDTAMAYCFASQPLVPLDPKPKGDAETVFLEATPQEVSALPNLPPRKASALGSNQVSTQGMAPEPPQDFGSSQSAQALAVAGQRFAVPRPPASPVVTALAWGTALNDPPPLTDQGSLLGAEGRTISPPNLGRTPEGQGEKGQGRGDTLAADSGFKAGLDKARGLEFAPAVIKGPKTAMKAEVPQRDADDAIAPQAAPQQRGVQGWAAQVISPVIEGQENSIAADGAQSAQISSPPRVTAGGAAPVASPLTLGAAPRLADSAGNGVRQSEGQDLAVQASGHVTKGAGSNFAAEGDAAVQILTHPRDLQGWTPRKPRAEMKVSAPQEIGFVRKMRGQGDQAPLDQALAPTPMVTGEKTAQGNQDLGPLSPPHLRPDPMPLADPQAGPDSAQSTPQAGRAAVRLAAKLGTAQHVPATSAVALQPAAAPLDRRLAEATQPFEPSFAPPRGAEKLGESLLDPAKTPVNTSFGAALFPAEAAILPQPVALASPHLVQPPKSALGLHHLPAIVEHLHQDAARHGHSHAEVLMNPAELGRIRFDLITQGGQVQVTLSVERPETLDLLRANAEALRQEFRTAGLTADTLSFGQWAQRPPARDQTESPQDQSNPAAEPQALVRPYVKPASSSGLDLRL